MLVGASRKGFIGKIVGGTCVCARWCVSSGFVSLSVCSFQAKPKPSPSCVAGAPPPHRPPLSLVSLPATACCRVSVFFSGLTGLRPRAGGANIIRVHDVKEQGEVIKVADAIYRNNWTSS
jgi:hypothetical protein